MTSADILLQFIANYRALRATGAVFVDKLDGGIHLALDAGAPAEMRAFCREIQAEAPRRLPGQTHLSSYVVFGDVTISIRSADYVTDVDRAERPDGGGP